MGSHTLQGGRTSLIPETTMPTIPTVDVVSGLSRTGAIVAAAVLAAVSLINAQQNAPDAILFNGRIITVDDRFSIAQAVAIRGDRFQAVGTNAEITKLAGPKTRRIDLRGRAVTPGLIDNHGHFMEEGAYWQLELRLDGVESRKQAAEMIRERAKVKGPGQWVFTLGGWSPDQFADDPRPFTREELDKIAPDNPVFLQFTREQTFVNSRAIDATGMDKINEPWVVRDANGRPTGVINGDGGTGQIRNAAGFLKELPKDIFESSSMRMLRDLNSAGLTSSGGGCQYEDIYRQWQRDNRLSMRFFCFRTAGGGGRGGGVEQVIAAMPKLRYFDGDEWIDHVNWGERLVNTPDTINDTKPTAPPELWASWGQMARAAAKAGITIFIHTTMEWTVEEQLRQVEQIAKEMPIRHLRWAFVHMEGVTPPQIERMRNLGMYIGVHPRGVISGAAFIRRRGERGYSMPPLKAIQDSGIQWGFGTDAFEVNQYRPFMTLYWAVTGKMVGGKVVNHNPISREDALIAHTRKNAYFFFRENDLGSIQPGKLADLVVIDRDYLTIPADQIKDIRPQMTMVGGRVVYEATTPSTQ
jgi:predicted amidohydrolase YtcJ